nr:peptigoglycan-binding protein LysM [Pseudomonas sp.]
LDDDMPAAGSETAPAASMESTAGSDFVFDLPEASAPEADLADEFDLSLDLDAEPEADNLTSQLEGVEAEIDELSRDLDAPVPTASADSADDMGEDFDFLSGTDETTTKLDLARAYIDMGDAEGARDILDEVITEGSDVQQQEAREMLAKLA